MKRPYIRVTLSDEQYAASTVLETFKTLQQAASATAATGGGLFSSSTSRSPPTFEFTMLTRGEDDPVTFYYGVDDPYMETLELQLKTLFPDSYVLERVETDLGKQLVPPEEFDVESFATAAIEDRLWADIDLSNDVSDPEELASNLTEIIDELTAGDTRAPLGIDETASAAALGYPIAPPTTLDPRAPPTAIDGPTAIDDGTILARRSPDEYRAAGVRWEAAGKTKRDRLCSLTPFSELVGDDGTVDDSGGPLVGVVTALAMTNRPTAYQVLFRPATAQVGKQKQLITDLRKSDFTRLERWVNSRTEKQPVDALAEGYKNRVTELQSIDPQYQYEATARVVTVQADTEDADLDTTHWESLLTPLNGDFYRLVPQQLHTEGYRSSTKRANARRAFERFRSRELKTSSSVLSSNRRWPTIEGSPDQLAGLAVPPAGDSLPRDIRRKVDVLAPEQTPLSVPRPSQLQQFTDGMAIGQLIDQTTDSNGDLVHIPPELLVRHLLLVAATGTGKSTAIQNHLLSLSASTDGPAILVTAKGGDLCEQYIRAHYHEFGTLDDVLYFDSATTLPGIPFFDIRADLAAGRSRQRAIEGRINHLSEVGRFLMDDTWDQAQFGLDALNHLIEAMYDPTHGSDAYQLADLTDAAYKLQEHRELPRVSLDNARIDRALASHLPDTPQEPAHTIDAVTNRLNTLERGALGQILNADPNWDPQTESYGDGTFDFRDILDEDVVVLFDLGDLRSEPAKAVITLLLSNLWNALKRRKSDPQPRRSDGLVNLIIDEAAPIVGTDLVSKDLIPQGREFGLSVELAMQFGEQVIGESSNRHEGMRYYREILNNVHTKIIGEISVDQGLPRALAHGELSEEELERRIRNMPSGRFLVSTHAPEFHEAPPKPFQVKALDPPLEGKTGSSSRLDGGSVDGYEIASDAVDARTDRQYGVDPDGGASTGQTLADHVMATSAGADTPQAEPDPTVNTGQPPATETGAGQPIPSSDQRGDGDSPDSVGVELFEHDDTETDESSGADTTENESQGPASAPRVAPDDRGPATELDLEYSRQTVVEALWRVLAAMNRDLEDYSLLDGMNLTGFFTDIDREVVNTLVEEGLLERHRVCNRRYYSITRDGREYMQTSLDRGEGIGDLGEKTPHKVGVSLLRLWIGAKDEVETVRIYYELDQGPVLDVVGFDDDGEIGWVGEVETASNNTRAVVDDYQKLAAVDAKTVWVFRNQNTQAEVLKTLIDEQLLDLSARDAARSFDDAKQAVEAQQAPGMSTISTFLRIDNKRDTLEATVADNQVSFGGVDDSDTTDCEHTSTTGNAREQSRMGSTTPSTRSPGSPTESPAISTKAATSSPTDSPDTKQAGRHDQDPPDDLDSEVEWEAVPDTSKAVIEAMYQSEPSSDDQSTDTAGDRS